jgi:hypothetical protein
METETSRLDGNALGGRLSEVFMEEMTTARVTCGGCGIADDAASGRVEDTARGCRARRVNATK